MTNRDHDLRQHYENKDLLIFVNGLDWFITQTNAIHTKHGSLNPDDDRSEWDLANGYYIGNYPDLKREKIIKIVNILNNIKF